jgi:hypothetical protein
MSIPHAEPDRSMPALRELRQAGAQVVAAAGIPYGYTLTVWGAGALCIGRFGLPSPAEVFGFVGGASVGYFGLALGSRRAIDVPRRGSGLPVLWENGAALPALAATYGLSQVTPGPAASFFLVPLAATVIYLVGVSLLVSRFHLGRRHVVEHERRLLGRTLADPVAPDPDAVPEGPELSPPDASRPSPGHRGML